MKKNMGSVDKIIRLLIAAVFILLFAFNLISGVFGYILLALAAIFILTSLFSFCPLYTLVGMNTSKPEKKV